MGKSVLGTKGKISGSNLFMRLNYWIVYCGGAIAENPPALVGVEAPSEAIITDISVQSKLIEEAPNRHYSGLGLRYLRNDVSNLRK